MEISGWDVAAVFAKAVTYAATFGASGAAFFLAYCRALLQDQRRVIIRRLIGILVGVAAAASILRILVLSGSMSGDLAGMFDGASASMILGAGEGGATGLRIVGLAFILLVFSTNPVFRIPAILGAIVAAASFAWVGHIRALAPNAAASLLLCLHLLCAAFWLGALPPLWLIAADADPLQVAATARRFGYLALRLAALLLAAGASLLLILIGHAAQFWASDYGRLMVIKLLAVAALLCVAAWNKRHLTPRLLKGDARAGVLFRRSVLLEMLLGALILLTTASFTTLTGPP